MEGNRGRAVVGVDDESAVSAANEVALRDGQHKKCFASREVISKRDRGAVGAAWPTASYLLAVEEEADFFERLG